MNSQLDLCTWRTNVSECNITIEPQDYVSRNVSNNDLVFSSYRMWFICISSGILLYCEFVLLHDSLKKALITFCVKYCVVNRHSRIVRNEQDFCCTLSTQFNHSYFQKWLFQEIKKTNHKRLSTLIMSQSASLLTLSHLSVNKHLPSEYPVIERCMEAIT